MLPLPTLGMFPIRMKKSLRPSLALDTLAVHAGTEARDADSPVVNPLYQSVNFIQEFGTAEGLRYPRYGNSPNAEVVQERIAALEGSEAACLLASGQGATVCALLALLRPGDHIATSAWIYGGTHRFLTEELTAFGIEVSLVDPLETRTWRRSLKKNTRVVFLETPVNPTCRVLDLRPIGQITHEAGVALVVDSTFASPINLRPLEHGADVVIHSATKYLNGHHDMLGGVVCGTAPYIDEVKQKMLLWGQAPDPFAAWLLERGLKTLAVRIQRHNENAMAIATWCATRKEIRAVHYAGLPTHPDHEIAKAMHGRVRGDDGDRARRRGRGRRPIRPKAEALSLCAQPRGRRFSRFRSQIHLPRPVHGGGAGGGRDRRRLPSPEHRH